MRSFWCLARGQGAQISLDAVRAVPETCADFPKWKELLQNCAMCLECFVLEEVWSPVAEPGWKKLVCKPASWNNLQWQIPGNEIIKKKKQENCTVADVSFLTACILWQSCYPLNKRRQKHNGRFCLCFYRCKPRATPEEFALIEQISTQIKERQNAFFDMEAYLPKKNGYVLRQERHVL